MLGNIIGINENEVQIKLNIDLKEFNNLINLYVIMEDEYRKTIGEIVNIKDQIAMINLLGEIKNDKFVFGVISKPAFNATVKLVSKEKTPLIIGVEQYIENKHLYIGKSAIYEDVDIHIDINQFFSNHFAIFGSTGSGKSCSVARIFQNLFAKDRVMAYKSSIFIFDAYGEYQSAFSQLHTKSPEISMKTYTTNLKTTDSEIVRIPVWLLGIDDLALLLGAESHNQIPIIEKMLKLVTVFGRDEELVIKHKNDIVARSILDILASGKSPTQIRDQIFSILSFYKTKELNLDTPVYQPGYTRALKQCLLIDNSGKIREMELVTNFMESFLDDTLELQLPDGSFKYTLEDLEKALDFALISEGILNSEKVYDDTNILKVRLHGLVNSEQSIFFDYPEYITKEAYIKKLMLQPNLKKAQIINFNINYVDDRFAKNLTKIYSKMLFDFTKELENRASFPIHIVLEEAHRYVQNDNDAQLLGYNIFDRITKEGRKYGIILGLITQRPSELSQTALSQCNNFLIFKMLHPVDIDFIRQMVPNITSEILRKLKILPPGTCVAFGLAFKVPVIIKLEMPNPAPSSSSCDISNIWFVAKKTSI
ncbi:MAG: ATP-binding protein [Bacilli bacterium]|nr:ATP-binding protein [Bacilli bacterium]